jgi:hypothetical protein
MKKSIVLIIFLPLILFSAENDSVKVWKPNPALAAGLSLAIPGAGQIYNRSYFKAPIAIGLEGYAIWRSISANSEMNDAENRGKNYPPSSEEFEIAKSDWKSARETRNIHLWVLVGAVLLSTIDAYVDAHLYGWEKEMADPIEPKRTSLEFSPYLDSTGNVGLALTLNF